MTKFIDFVVRAWNPTENSTYSVEAIYLSFHKLILDGSETGTYRIHEVVEGLDKLGIAAEVMDVGVYDVQ